MAEPSPLPDTRDAFALLSKPTLQLTDEEVTLVCADLRKRREAFLQGRADKPPRKAAPQKSPEEKQALLAGLEAELGL